MQNSAVFTYFGMTPATILRSLLVITGLFAICHMVSYLMGHPSWQLERLFDLGNDGNLPTWFSSSLWLAAACLAYECSRREPVERHKRVWFFISLGLLIFSADEVAMLHENATRVVFRHVLPVGVKAHCKATTWPLLAAPFIALVIFWLVTSFRKSMSGSSLAWRLMFFGFLIVVAGAAGLEMTINWLNHDHLEWLWQIETVFEETLEMVGAITILSGLFTQINFLKRETPCPAS